MTRRLVVNADDLGLTEGVNDGIFDAHTLGILTSASIFANAPATDNAIRRAPAHPSLGIGVHLTLVDGTPILPAREVPTLVTADGRFPPSWRPFIVACLRGRVSLDEVERELTAQIERVLRRLPVTHLDAHKHVHAYPPVFAIVARLAARFGVPVVRVPYERFSTAAALGHERAGRTTRRQAWLNGALWPWARRNYRVAASLGLETPALVGRIDTGVLEARSLHRMLAGIGPGVTELMVHPGYVDDALRRTPTRLIDSRIEELALLCSTGTRALVAAEGIHLVRHGAAAHLERSLRHAS